MKLKLWSIFYQILIFDGMSSFDVSGSFQKSIFSSMTTFELVELVRERAGKRVGERVGELSIVCIRLSSSVWTSELVSVCVRVSSSLPKEWWIEYGRVFGTAFA